MVRIGRAWSGLTRHGYSRQAWHSWVSPGEAGCGNKFKAGLVCRRVVGFDGSWIGRHGEQGSGLARKVLERNSRQARLGMARIGLARQNLVGQDRSGSVMPREERLGEAIQGRLGSEGSGASGYGVEGTGMVGPGEEFKAG